MKRPVGLAIIWDKIFPVSAVEVLTFYFFFFKLNVVDVDKFVNLPIFYFKQYYYPEDMLVQKAHYT